MYYSISANNLQDKNIPPTTLKVIPEAIAKTLKQKDAWVNWYWHYKPERQRWTKVPCGDRGFQLATNNPENWRRYSAVLNTYNISRTTGGTIAGLGIVLDGYVGVDLDKCRNPDTGAISARAQAVIELLDTYAEVSPSGTGVKLIAAGSLPGDAFKLPELEMYAYPRYFTVTGHTVGRQCDVMARQEQINQLFAEYAPKKEPTRPASDQPMTADDEEIIETCRNYSNGNKFCALWKGDQDELVRLGYTDAAGKFDWSRADAALVRLLWFACHNRSQTDRLFRSSGLMRTKWEGDDYRNRTFKFACREAERDDIRLLTGEPEASEPEVKVVPKPRKRGYLFSELHEIEPPKWLIRGLIPSNSLVTLFGDSDVYKSFNALDMALCVATGKPYLDSYDVTQGPVVYIAAEGISGIRWRIEAWRKKYPDYAHLAHNAFLIPQVFELHRTGEIEQILDIIDKDFGKVPVMTFIDTIPRHMEGGDENSFTDMGTVVRGLDQLRNTYDCTVLGITHCGIEDKLRERGHSSLRGAADTRIRTKRVGDFEPVLICAKQKDYKPFDDICLKGHKIDLGETADGDTADSLVFTLDNPAVAAWKSLNEATKDLYATILNRFGLNEWFGPGQLTQVSSTSRNRRLNELTIKKFLEHNGVMSKNSRFKAIWEHP